MDETRNEMPLVSIKPSILKALPQLIIGSLLVIAAVLIPFAQLDSVVVIFLSVLFGLIGLLTLITSVVYLTRVRIWADQDTVKCTGMIGSLKSCSRQDLDSIQQRGIFPSRYSSPRLAFVKKDGSDAFSLSSGTLWKKTELKNFASYLGVPFKRQLFSS